MGVVVGVEREAQYKQCRDSPWRVFTERDKACHSSLATSPPPSSRPTGEQERGDALKPRQMSEQSYLANKAS